MGLGFPYEGPAPLEAIANGCFFINPKVSKKLRNTSDEFQVSSHIAFSFFISFEFSFYCDCQVMCLKQSFNSPLPLFLSFLVYSTEESGKHAVFQRQAHAKTGKKKSMVFITNNTICVI